jgi:hypothetical protein
MYEKSYGYFAFVPFVPFVPLVAFVVSIFIESIIIESIFVLVSTGAGARAGVVVSAGGVSVLEQAATAKTAAARATRFMRILLNGVGEPSRTLLSVARVRGPLGGVKSRFAGRGVKKNARFGWLSSAASP